MQDVSSSIEAFVESGDHIILLIDGNSNMISSDLQLFLSSLHLHEVILEKHGTNGPETHRKNTTSTTNDRTWASVGIQVALTIDAYRWTLHLFKYSGKTCHSFIDLECKNYTAKTPDWSLITTGCFITLLTRSMSSQKLKNWQFPKVYKALDELWCQFVRFAQDMCSKIRSGNAPFSLVLKKASQLIRVWSLPVNKNLGKRPAPDFFEDLLRKPDWR